MWRVAIIGCGNIAGGYDEFSPDGCQTHAGAIKRHAGLQLVSVCDIDATKAERFASTWNVPAFHSDVRRMLEIEKPDMVAICSPTETHAGMLECCLETPGIRLVLCEKPAGLDPARLAAILPKLEAAGIALAVNYTRAYVPGIQQLRQRLDELGGCVEAFLDYGKGIFNYGSHAIQWFSDWLGEITNLAVFETHAASRPRDMDVSATFLAGGVPVRIRSCPDDRFDVEFRCSNGSLKFLEYAFRVTDGAGTVSTALESGMGDVYASMIAQLEGRPARLVGGPEALDVLTVCAALSLSPQKFS
jgi:predicted dehydrogenase